MSQRLEEDVTRFSILMKSCPKCHRHNPSDAWMCVCGYEFPWSESERSTMPLVGSHIRRVWMWLLLPVGAWFCSVPALGTGAFFLPVVVFQAPLGIIGLFEKITLEPTKEQMVFIIAIHAIFWFFWMAGIVFRQTMALPWLRLLWLMLAAVLFMSIYGCATQLGPGLRDPGNWH